VKAEPEPRPCLEQASRALREDVAVLADDVLAEVADDLAAFSGAGPPSQAMTHFYALIVGILGIWRITHLLNAEDGPGKIFVRLRRLAAFGFWGELLDCFYCLSVWIALPFAWWLGHGWQQQLLLWPALSGSAILLDRITGGPTLHSPDARMPVSEAAEDSLNDKEH